MFLDPGAIRHIARIGVKFGSQIAHHHRATIPFQPEPYPLCCRLVHSRSVWPQVIPVIMIAVAAFTETARFPPEQPVALFTPFLCGQGQGRKKAIDACGVLYMSAYLVKAELYEDRSRSLLCRCAGGCDPAYAHMVRCGHQPQTAFREPPALTDRGFLPHHAAHMAQLAQIAFDGTVFHCEQGGHFTHREQGVIQAARQKSEQTTTERESQ